MQCGTNMFLVRSKSRTVLVFLNTHKGNRRQGSGFASRPTCEIGTRRKPEETGMRAVDIQVMPRNCRAGRATREVDVMDWAGRAPQ
jgi:hypothetical protein